MPASDASESTSAAALRGLRATRAVVDLDAIAGNVRALCAAAAPGTSLMAIVKADGYGHGALEVAKTALAAGAACLGVATVSEGRELRANGIAASTLILGSLEPGEAHAAALAGLQITVADFPLLAAVQAAARQPGAPGPVSVQLKIDTGLRRYGALPGAALALVTAICSDPYLHLAGIFTHLASADEPADRFTRAQLEEFDTALQEIRDAGVELPALHAANSAGLLTDQGSRLGFVRPGIALYGVPPSDEVALLPGMRPAMRIESRITRIVTIANGESVGYNRTFRAQRQMRGALVPIGYADGYRRSLSNNGWVGLGSRRARVLGRVSMDQIVVEVPEDSSAAIGDMVDILGHGAAPSIAELAALMSTNTYEVLVGIRRRVPRVYLRSGEPKAYREEGTLTQLF